MNASIALADPRTRENFAIADTVGELITALSAFDPQMPATRALIDQAAALILPPSSITLFAESYPRAVDIDESLYKSDQTAYDAAATASGYRLAGFRLHRAVFTTKS